MKRVISITIATIVIAVLNFSFETTSNNSTGISLKNLFSNQIANAEGGINTEVTCYTYFKYGNRFNIYICSNQCGVKDVEDFTRSGKCNP